MEDIVTGVESTETAEEEAETHDGNADSWDMDDDEDDFLPPESREKNPFQCDLCSKILSSKQALNVHTNTHVDAASRQTFQCEICEASFKSQRGLRYHLDTKHISESNRKKLPCPTCGRIFKSAEGRKIHMTIQHGADGPIFKCQECPMIFARKPHLDLHMTTHGSGLHVCKICGKPYARLKDLSRHEATCGVKELCCPVCGKQFRREQALENHKKKCRPNSQNVPCLICGQGFATEQALKVHQAVHRRTFHCEECAQTFGTAQALRNHEQTKHGKTVDFEDEVGEKRGHRMRRSKFDLYIGLEHLVDPSKLIKEEKPDEIEIKPKDPTPRRVACEFCTLNFVTMKALMNHKQRRHWEALGLQEPIPERRGRKRTRPLQRVPKKIGRPRKVINSGNSKEVTEEAKIDDEKEENELRLEDETVVITANQVDPEGLLEEITASATRNSDDTTLAEATMDSVDNAVKFKTLYIEEQNELNEEIIKQEIIEFEDCGYDHFENDSICSEEPFDELPFENVVADSETLEEQTTDEVDTLAVEPKLETTLTSEPQVTKELVIILEKLDYSALSKPPVKKIRPFKSKYKNPLPRVECEHCGQTFAIRYRLALHRIKEHGSTEIAVPNSYKKPMLPLNFHCDQCNKSYHLETNLAIHKEKVHQTGKAPTKGMRTITKRTCRHCEKQMNSFKGLVYHLKFVHGETVDESQLIRCPKCHKIFMTTEEMAQHVCFRETPAVKETERPFQCDLCDKAYTLMRNLEDHYSVHPEYQHVKCDQCSKGFFKERQLSKHKEVFHKSLEMYLSCEICNLRLKTIQSLKRHQELHNDRESYCCEHCGKKFKTRFNLRAHKFHSHPEHVGETAMANQAIPCKICGKKLRGKSNFKLHMRRHNNDPPHKCSFPSCDRTFYSTHSKKIHEQSHTKDYTYKCNFCEYGTVVRQRIVLHEQREHNYNRLATENAA